VVAQSEDCLKSQLQSTEHHLETPDIGVYRLLEISLGWPEGLRILLRAYAPEIEECHMGELLRNAVIFGLVESVRVLLDQDAPVYYAHLSLCASADLGVMVIQYFIARRAYLHELGMTILPQQVQQHLGLQISQLPDKNAREVYTELEAIHTSIHPSCRLHELCPIFHHALRIDQMEHLYEAGFQDFDAVDENNYTPVLCLPGYPRDLNPSWYVIDRTLWLIDRGASLDFPQRNWHITPNYILSANIAQAFFDDQVLLRKPQLNALQGLPVTHRNFLRRMCTTDCRDKCCCYCSAAGCSSLSAALRHLLRLLSSDDDYDDFVLYLGQGEKAARALQSLVTEVQGGPGVSQEVIRLLTFTDLELTHTCCRVRILRHKSGVHNFTTWGQDFLFQAFDEDETMEIHDEEQNLLVEFEDLVEQLNADYTSSGISLWEFLQTHWSQRVMDYLSQNGETIHVDSLCSLL
jgi:hypothetical protein